MDIQPKKASQKVNDFFEENMATIATVCLVVAAYQLVGVKRSNKKLYKAFKTVVQNRDNDMLNMQNTIGALRKAGTYHTYYPGIGVYADNFSN